MLFNPLKNGAIQNGSTYANVARIPIANTKLKNSLIVFIVYYTTVSN